MLFQQPSPGVLLTQLYLFGDQQPVRVLDGRALVQQQGLELPLLNVIESVKHNSQKLRRQGKKWCFDPYTLQGFREARKGIACSRNADGGWSGRGPAGMRDPTKGSPSSRH